MLPQSWDDYSVYMDTLNFDALSANFVLIILKIAKDCNNTSCMIV